jgi:ArsR family transcriptional regulator, nickel/cobalt-responsive transcriptional repressor
MYIHFVAKTKALAQYFDSSLFQVLVEPVRVDILRYLAEHGSSDIGTIAGAFPQDRSVISRHLQLMGRIGIVTREKQSRNVLYSIDGPALVAKIESNLETLKRLVPDCCGPSKP